ncbi:MAG: hypothetical protein JNL67_02160 [Planctomycetaceae bacterium]|nr:hypothetical protein [Planctomycetaceae bacterium]
MKNQIVSSVDFLSKSMPASGDRKATDARAVATIKELDSHDWGGKTINLLRLAAAGFPVPPLVAVSADLFRTLVGQQREVRELLEQLGGQQSQSLEGIARRLREAFQQAEFPASLRSGLVAKLAANGLADSYVAVRSSASDEDGADFSFAGMHDSFLFVRGLEEIILAIKKVWASAFQPRALAYRLENKIPLDRLGVSVIIQQMIVAKASGVVFTINPANNRTDQVLVSSVWGAGEGLVSGALPADTFVVNKGDAAIQADIVEKPQRVELDEQRRLGSRLIDVPIAEQLAPSLSNDQIREVSNVSQEIERHYRRPQDVEFCFDTSGRLFIVQARPVTRVEQYGPAAGNRMVWDNSNIIESYSGVTTPMTFSFIRRAYTIVYHCFSEVMGISPAKVRASRGVFENMLGLIRGRVYYNLPNWYRLIRLFPGFQYNAKFMESMMGLKEPLLLDDPDPPLTIWRKWFIELPALLRLLARTSWNFWRIRSIVDRFQSHFKSHYEVWDNLDFRSQSPRDLKRLYGEMEDALLWNWKAPIINDFYVMVNYGLLKHLCRKWVGDESGALQNDLICGEGGVESAEPAKMLLRLAAIAIDNPELKQLIETTALEEVVDRIKQDSRFTAFNDLMATYLKLYGFRCMNELKLEEFSLRDRPHLVYQVLRNYLRLEDRSALDVQAMHEREQATRREAEAKAFAGITGWSGWWRRWLFGRVLRSARLGVKNRENMRFARTRIYGLLREILRALGGQLAEEKILPNAEDIFYLTIDEVWDYLQGTAVSTNLAELAQLRRAEYDRFRAVEAPDDRFETFGYVYHKNLFRRVVETQAVPADGQLRGIGCCPGTVTRQVRVLSSPADDLTLNGEILVAERTDPGWVPLYPAVSGILIERGSVLSHSAVVAREMGIPTIVGIVGLLKTIKDGDTVTMDGGAGTVRPLEPSIK